MLKNVYVMQEKTALWRERVRHVTRWSEWGASKLPLYFVGMFYSILRSERPGIEQAVQLMFLVVLLGLFAIFGHMINDYADLAADRQSGKVKLIATWRKPAALGAIAIPGIGTLAIALVVFNGVTFAVTTLAVVVAAVYSLPPVRLKERGRSGWAAATAAQRVLPLAIVFEALGGWDWVSVGFCLLNTLIGLRFIIVHQLRDHDNDRRSGVRTMATTNGPLRLDADLRGLFRLEVAAACAVVTAMSDVEPLLGLPAIAYVFNLAAAGRQDRALSPASYLVFDAFYSVLWPMSLAVLLAVRDPIFLPAMLGVGLLVQKKARHYYRDAFIKPEPSRRRAADRDHTPLPQGAKNSDPPAAKAPQPAVKLQRNNADPYPFYAQLRAQGPLLKLDWPGLGSAWVVTQYSAALQVLRDARFIKDARRLGATDDEHSARPGPVRGFGRDMVELDPPDHTRLRNLLIKGFSPRTVARLEPRIEQIANQLLDRAKPSGEIELIADYAAAMPIMVICELLGVPIADIGRFRAFMYALSLSQTLGQSNPDLQAAKTRFTAQLRGLISARRQTPRDDIVSALVQAEQDGDQLSSDELIGMIYLLLLAGFVTTVNLIGNGTLALLRHPEQLALLRQDPALGETAIEELLRFDAPLALSSVSYASADIEFAGRRVPKGAPLRVIIPSANRDDQQFPDADTLDITRNPCPHLSLGYGIHYCLGAPLARLEGRIAIRLLLERMPDLQMSDRLPLQWLSHPMFRGLQHLPLRF